MKKQENFKVGDRVVCIDTAGNSKSLPGYHGVIRHIDSGHPPILVEFDEFMGGHEGFDAYTGKDGHCYFCYPYELVRESEFETVDIKFSFDDFILGTTP